MALNDCACFSGFPALPFRDEVIRKLYSMLLFLTFCSGMVAIATGVSDLNFAFGSVNFQSGWSVTSVPLSIIRGVSGRVNVSGAVGLHKTYKVIIRKNVLGDNCVKYLRIQLWV